MKITIWLEIHIKLSTPNKLFCRCENIQDFVDLEPNTHICPVCTAQPGALPTVSMECIDKAVQLGKLLNCTIQDGFYFDRKNYFYPDLVMGYQITQLSRPININWQVNYWIDNYKTKLTAKITQAHLENDTAKSIHSEGMTLIDWNRSGTPLVEIVTGPDFHSHEEVVDFLKELQRLIKWNNIWSADLDKGQMRVDVNVSISPDETLWTRVEIKNINTFASIRNAINYEVSRQTELLAKWEKVMQETRRRNDPTGMTIGMRSKEDAHDYRYFPEPDILPIHITNHDSDNNLENKNSLALSETEYYDKLISIIWNYENFLINIENNLKNKNIDTSDMYIDHISLRTSTDEIYKNRKTEITQIAKIINESMIAWRQVSIWKLDRPIKHNNKDIYILEVSAPKANKVYPDTLDHVEFVTKSPLDELINKYTNISREKKWLAREWNQDIEVEFEDWTSVKFHNQSLEDVVKSENSSSVNNQYIPATIISQMLDRWFNKEYINWLIQSQDIYIYFHSLVDKWIDAKTAAKWIVGSLMSYCTNSEISTSKIPLDRFTAFVQNVIKYNLKDTNAKIALETMVEENIDSQSAISKHWFDKVETLDYIWLSHQAMDANPSIVEQYRSGKTPVIMFLVWQVMKLSWGKADATAAKQALEVELAK